MSKQGVPFNATKQLCDGQPPIHRLSGMEVWITHEAYEGLFDELVQTYSDYKK